MTPPLASKSLSLLRLARASRGIDVPGHCRGSAYKDAPTRTVSNGGVEFAYRELGPKVGVPVIFLVHLAGNLDNWDPRVVDGIAAKCRVITFDNRVDSPRPWRRVTHEDRRRLYRVGAGNSIRA
jgi:hypothetical protein